eukprot:scaffold107439_cov26-Tisochrysis_lutea.AAC.1
MAASQVVGSSVAGQSMAAGDPGMADAVLAVREAQNVMLELAARLPDKKLEEAVHEVQKVVLKSWLCAWQTKSDAEELAVRLADKGNGGRKSAEHAAGSGCAKLRRRQAKSS